MTNDTDTARDLILLEQIEQNPDATQASLAGAVGVAVGTINWHIKRLIEKGYVKVRRAERKKLRYIITPEGIALRARLTVDYIQTGLRLYRLVRERVLERIRELHQAGYRQVRLSGASGEVAEICRLTCLEQGVEIIDGGDVPLMEVRGLKVFLHLKEETQHE